MKQRFHLDHLQILSPQPAALAEFYASATLGKSTQVDESVWFCEGPARRLLFSEGGPNALGFAGYVCADEPTLARLRDRVAEHGAQIHDSCSPLFADREAFAVVDSDGNRSEFSTEGTAASGSAALSGRLQHVVVASREIDPLLPLYTEGLGFEISDRVEDGNKEATACFLRSDPEHHSFGVFAASDSRLDHHSYETDNWDDIRDWADHLSGIHVELAWGPGRHGPGNNLFLMFDDPDGNKIEISAEIERIENGRPMGLWEHNERTLNLWGRGWLRKEPACSGTG